MNVSKARELAGNVGFISCQNINEKVFCNESPKGNILVILFFEEFFFRESNATPHSYVTQI